jgi:hypothetical protein
VHNRSHDAHISRRIAELGRHHLRSFPAAVTTAAAAAAAAAADLHINDHPRRRTTLSAHDERRSGQEDTKQRNLFFLLGLPKWKASSRAQSVNRACSCSYHQALPLWMFVPVAAVATVVDISTFTESCGSKSGAGVPGGHLPARVQTMGTPGISCCCISARTRVSGVIRRGSDDICSDEAVHAAYQLIRKTGP